MPDEKNTNSSPRPETQTTEKRHQDFAQEKVIKPNENKRPPQPKETENE